MNVVDCGKFSRPVKETSLADPLVQMGNSVPGIGTVRTPRVHRNLNLLLLNLNDMFHKSMYDIVSEMGLEKYYRVSKPLSFRMSWKGKGV